MKESKRKANLTDNGYIPFKLEEINKTKKLDSILILNDGKIEGGADKRGDDTAVGF